MKTKLLFFAAIAALMLVSCSKERETTEPAPPPTPDEAQYDVYVAGSYRKGVETFDACYWKNGELHKLSYPGNITISPSEIVVADGSVYISADNRDLGGYWKDGVWHENATPQGADGVRVYSIAVCKGSVYTVGCFITTNLNKYIYTPGYWKDGVWNGLSLPGDATSGYATSIAIGGGSVYITGDVEVGKYTGYWKDGVWQDMERPEGVITARCGQITCSDGSVYVAGKYNKESESHKCYWVNGVLHDFSAPEGMNYSIQSLAVSDGSIYVAGNYVVGEDPLKAFYAKDGFFATLEAPGRLVTGDIRITAAEGVTYVSGDYVDKNKTGHACYWKDGVRTDLPAPEGMSATTAGIAVAKR